MSDTIEQNYTKLNKKYICLKKENEQLKAKVKELEEEKQNLNDFYWAKVNELDEEYNKDLEERFLEIEKLQQENTELKKKLENAIVPKFKIGQEVFYIDSVKTISAKIEKIITSIAKNEEENITKYSITDCYGYAFRFIEEDLFATKEEAENRLKEQKGE